MVFADIFADMMTKMTIGRGNKLVDKTKASLRLRTGKLADNITEAGARVRMTSRCQKGPAKSNQANLSQPFSFNMNIRRIGGVVGKLEDARVLR